jgi:hypothetical protein
MRAGTRVLYIFGSTQNGCVPHSLLLNAQRGWAGVPSVKPVGVGKLTTQFSLVPRLRIHGAKPPLAYMLSAWENGGFLTLTNAVNYSTHVSQC